MKREPEDVPIDEKVAFLQRPSSYPDGAGACIDTIETHMSWVFLSDRHAYKLKKPLRHDFFDLRTIAARRENCATELALNRRLAAPVYLAMVPLTLREEGGLELNGAGPVTDWLVKMQRLPAGRMLDAAIRCGGVSSDDIRRVSRVLTAFYRRALREPMAPTAYCQMLEHAAQGIAAELGLPRYGLPAEQIMRIVVVQRCFLARREALLGPRAALIIDGHGDLRPEHVCLLDEPVIIDCLEFKRELRLLDPVDELAYLALECERLGAPEVGCQILRNYAETTGDRVPDALVHFYQSYRAGVRAQIAIWHLKDGAVRNHDRWRRRAREYLDLAERHAQGCLAETLATR